MGNVNSISADDEFNTKKIKELLEARNINYHFDIAKNDHITKGDKLGIIDRFVRTFRAMLTKYIYSNDNANWINKIDKIAKNYNNTFHSSIKDSPNNVFENEELQ